MKFTSPNGRSYEWDKPTPPTQADIDELVAYDNSLGKKSAGEKAADIAGDIAVEAGTSMGGQLLGAETGPGYLLVAPAAGAYGNYLKQQREIDRGDREKVSYGEMLSSALINLIPASSMVKSGATVGRTIAKQAAIGAAIGVTPEVAKTALDQQRWPTLDDYYTYLEKGVSGAALGSAAGAGLEMAKNLSPAAKKLWSRMAGKTQDEASQAIQQIAQEGSEAERKAAGEIFDTVGQQMGLVREVASKSAQESAAVMGAVPVKSAKEAASVLAEAPLTAEEAASRRVGVLQPKSAQESAEIMGAIPAPAKSAQESAELLMQQMSPAERSALAFSEAYRQGQSPAAAQALRARLAGQQALSEQNLARSRQFEQAKAEELQQALRGGQAAGPESTILTGGPERAQLSVLDTRSGAAARERARLRQKLGIQEEVLPSTEDVLSEFSSLRGVGSKQRAKAMGLESGRASIGAIAGIGAAGAAGVGAVSMMGAEKPKTIVVETEMGPLKYDSKDWSLADIEQDVAKKRKEFARIKAAEPHLELRQNYENAPDEQSRLKMLFDWSTSRRMAGDVAKVMMQTAGSRLPMAARPIVGAGSEMTRGFISGEKPTEGQIAQAAIQSLPRGGTTFGSNLLQFAGANVAGEAAKQAIDRKDMLDFKSAADAAARGGVQAAAMQAVTASPYGRYAAQKRDKFAGEIEVFKEADRLGIVLDPSAMVGARTGQIAAVKAAGGSPRFQADAARVNIPVVQEKFVELAGKTGNPNLDGKLSSEFFKAKRLEEGQIYGQIAQLPGMNSVVQQWKDANFNAAREYAKNGRTGDPEALQAARAYRDEANNLFARIELEARRAGGQQMVTDLQRAKTKIAQLHAMESAVNPANYLPDNVKSMGQMFRDNPEYFTGDLRSIARIAAAQEGVFGPVIGTRALAKQDLASVPFLRAFLQTPTGQRTMGTYGPDPTMAAQLARFGAGTALEQTQRPAPYR